MRFKLNDKEEEKAKNFLREHIHYPEYSCYITYIFRPTSIGDTVKIKCDVCNREEDITDIESW